jgi:hypothetical protein
MSELSPNSFTKALMRKCNHCGIMSP